MLKEKLFGNIGKKLKTLALVNFILDFIIAIIGSFILCVFIFDDDLIPPFYLFFAVMIVVSFFLSWIFSLPLYAFGELLENICTIKNCLTEDKSEYIIKDNSVHKVNNDKIEKIDKLFAEGLITEEEYNDAKASSEVNK